MIADRDFLVLLEADVEHLLRRHVSKVKEWYPHEFVPNDGGALASSEVLASAVYLNLLTEDNLPYYTSAVDRWFGRDGAWGEWTRRWTAEEGRHSIALREWVHATRIIDPYELERARMETALRGLPVQDHDATAAQALVYVTVQELATRIAHGNTANLADEFGRKLMHRIAVDENLHFLFYRDLVTAFVERAPSDAVLAIDEVMRTFHMPGAGIPHFRHHAAIISKAGVYNASIHLTQVLHTLVRHWRIEDLCSLTPEAEQARERLAKHLRGLRRVADTLDRLARRHETRTAAH